jgi:short subunit fatty acids transporter
MSAASLLLVFLPFLLSLAGKAPMPWLLCSVTSLLAMLLSVQPGAAVLPWGLGMVIAAVSVRERIRSIYGR